MSEVTNDSSITIHEFFIAGVRFHQLDSVVNDIAVNDNLTLVPEPSNKFDPNAVKIEFVSSSKQAFLGYVPKKFSSQICAAIEVGKELKCVLVEYNKTAKPWEKLKVEIREIAT
jgi:hypothetical protein